MLFAFFWARTTQSSLCHSYPKALEPTAPHSFEERIVLRTKSIFGEGGSFVLFTGTFSYYNIKKITSFILEIFLQPERSSAGNMWDLLMSYHLWMWFWSSCTKQMFTWTLIAVELFSSLRLQWPLEKWYMSICIFNRLYSKEISCCAQLTCILLLRHKWGREIGHILRL